MLTQEDLKLLKKKGITPETLEVQINRFKSGFPFLKVKSVATVGNGIMRLSDESANHYIDLWNARLSEGCKVVKFVPASGAASRMFKNLFEFISSGRQTPETDFEKKFFEGIKNFAFYESLDKACINKHGQDIDALMQAGRHVDIVKCLITKDGLDYGSLPKGLLLFHKTGNVVHTPVEEHLEEAPVARSPHALPAVHAYEGQAHSDVFAIGHAASRCRRHRAVCSRAETAKRLTLVN